MADLTGLIIPQSICQSKMTPSEKLIAGAVIAMADNHGICSASNDLIAEITGLSSSTVANIIISMSQIGTMKIATSEIGQNPKTCRIIKVPQFLIDQCTELGHTYRFIVCTSNKNQDLKPTITETKKDMHTRWKREMLYYLNTKLGLTGKHIFRSTFGLSARFNDGVTLEDCILIIDHKYVQWGDDKKMREHICPETLFGIRHFPKYLRAASMWDENGRPALQRENKHAKDEIRIELEEKKERLHSKWLLLGEEYDTIELNPDKTDADRERMLAIRDEQDELYETAAYVVKRIKGL